MSQYSERRKRVLESIEGKGAVILFSGKAPMRSEDEAYPFSINRNFYYLTGLDKEEMVLVILKTDFYSGEILFIQPYDENLARWVGGRMTQEEASQATGIRDIRDLSELDSLFAGLFNRNRTSDDFKVYFDLWHYTFDQEETIAIRYANNLKKNFLTGERYLSCLNRDASCQG